MAAAAEPQQISWGIYTAEAGGRGVLIQGFTPDSPAAKAGLQAGDVLLAIDGAAVRSVQEFRAVKNNFPLYTPLRLTISRGGAVLERQIVLTGRVRLAVQEVTAAFAIPGVPPPPTAAPSAIEALDAVNVLDQVVLDPQTGRIAIIGHYDKNYNTGPIPYLDLLKTALANPTPRLNIIPAPATKKVLEDLKPVIVARLENTGANEIPDMVQGHPGLERERQQMIRELAAAYGLTPEEYAAWYNYCRFDVIGEGNAEALPPAAIAAIQVKAFRSLGYEEVARALELLYQRTPEAEAQALQALGRGEEAAASLARGGTAEARFGAMAGAVFVAAAEQMRLAGPETAAELRKRLATGSMTWQEAAKTAQNLMPYYRKNSNVNLMNQAFNRITLSPAATGAFFPQLPPIYSVIEPIGLDGGSQLARIMFEADYALKSAVTVPELFIRLSGFRTGPEFKAENKLVGGSGAKTSRIWIEPKLVAMTATPERNVVSFGTAQMTVFSADANDLVDLLPQKEEAAEPYTAWRAHHLEAGFEEYARIIPAFHKVREAAKVIALAQWLQAGKVPVDLGGAAQEKWTMPDKFPLQCIVSQAYLPAADGKTLLTTYLVTEGGINFKPKGNWTQMTPAPVGETKVTGQLVLSAGLGQKAVTAAQSGDLESARYLAELSAQAMNGSLTKSDLAKLNIAVPEPKAAPVTAAGVQLQKELIKQTHKQIATLSQNPASAAAANAALGQLGNLYTQVNNNPAAASDYLLKLQTGQLGDVPPAAPPAAAKQPEITVCGESSLGAETLPAERRAYLTKKLGEARDRLKYINEALRRLIAINAAERAEIDRLTAAMTKDFEAAKDRAWEFAIATLFDLPMDKYMDIHNSKIKQMKDEIAGLIARSSTPMSDAARAALAEEIRLKSALAANYADSVANTARLLDLYKGANYAKDIDKWEQAGKESGGFQRGVDTALLIGKILLDHPRLEEFLKKKEWFANDKLWQVVTMGKMAAYASDFFWDVMDLYVVWGPQVARMKNDLRYNMQAMEQLREKAARVSREIDCLEGLLR